MADKIIFYDGVNIDTSDTHTSGGLLFKNSTGNVLSGFKKTSESTNTYNLTYTNGTIDTLTIYKKDKDKDIEEYYCDISDIKPVINDGVPTYTIVDYNVPSNKSIKYILKPNKGSNPNGVIATRYLTPHWTKWNIISLDYDIEQNIYHPTGLNFYFNSNVSAGSITHNKSTIKYDTLSQYGTVGHSDMFYESGSLTCLFSSFKVAQKIDRYSKMIMVYNDAAEYSEDDDIAKLTESEQEEQENDIGHSKFKNFIGCVKHSIDGTMSYYKWTVESWELYPDSYIYLEESEKYEQWKQMLQDHRPKLLRDPKGNCWIVSITDAPTREINYNISQYPTTISFNWTEIEDSKNVAVLDYSTETHTL